MENKEDVKYIKKNITTSYIKRIVLNSLPKAYKIILDVKYSPKKDLCHRVNNDTSSIEEFLKFENAKHIKIDATFRYPQVPEDYYSLVVDYSNDDGWHFLWMYFKKELLQEIVEKYKFKKL